MGLAATELGDEREDRCRVFRHPGKAPKHHTCMLIQCSRKTCAREKLRRIAIVFRRGSLDDLFESNGELVRTERAAFPYFLAKRSYFVPGIESHFTEPIYFGIRYELSGVISAEVLKHWGLNHRGATKRRNVSINSFRSVQAFFAAYCVATF